MQLLARAAAFAVEEFSSKTRKGSGAPYITHLFAVAALVGEHGGSEVEMAAALLHDWLEDIDGATLNRLNQEFGPAVSQIVLACSDTVTRPKPPWKDRKTRHLKHMRRQPEKVKRVLAADKLHNGSALLADVRAQGNVAFDIFNAPRDDVLWYYREAHAALADGWSHPLLDELGAVVRALNLEAVQLP